MTHLLVIRCCKDYVYNSKSNYGTHQIIERNISTKKYPLNGVREGYNIPFGSEWHFMDYRLKKEIVPLFVRDLRAINLNPSPNNVSLYTVFTNKYISVGRLFLIIQWCFKWINRKKLSFSLLLILGVLTSQYWMFILGLVILVNPIKPVPVADEGEINDFRSGNWSYDFVYGVLNDPTEKITDKNTNKTYVQEDVL